MLIEQIIEFEWKGPWNVGRTCTPIAAYFPYKILLLYKFLLLLLLLLLQNKNLKKSYSKLLFTAKILQEAMCLTSPYLGQISYKI